MISLRDRSYLAAFVLGLGLIADTQAQDLPAPLPPLPAEAASGWTLDAAIERLVRHGPELRARFLDIPQAEADVLTASLRANPTLLTQAQLIPYQQFTEARPGGQTQYDLNVSIPLDLTHKRRARVITARRAKRVVEAQYQDAVRLQIDALTRAFVDVQAAAARLDLARSAIGGLAKREEIARTRKEQGLGTAADLGRVRIERHTAELQVRESERGVRRSSTDLAVLLGLDPASVESIAVSGSFELDPTEPPPAEELISSAMASRPDLIAARLAIGQAEAAVGQAHAERMADASLIVQPYTFQDNSPFGLKSAHSFGVGLAVPLPFHNRNQGNVQRARVGVEKALVGLAALERRVAAEAAQADREYRLTRETLRLVEDELIREARVIREEARVLERGGETALADVLTADKVYREFEARALDARVAHRRACYSLNTAVGRRLFP